MELFDTTQLSLERALQGAALRQSALATNVANVNTPGYQRQDVDFQGALQSALRSGRAEIERVSFGIQTDPSRTVRADGSGLDIDTEAAALARNGLDYEALVRIARARIDIIETAMGSR